MKTIVVLNDWTKKLLIPKYIPACKIQIPETWNEFVKFCKKVEKKTKNKKRCLIVLATGEIKIYIANGWSTVGFCLSLRNIDNPDKKIVHIYMFKTIIPKEVFYDSFDMGIKQSYFFIKSLLEEQKQYDR